MATRGTFDNSGGHWYSKENGNEIERKTYDDLSFLTMMPNLRFLEIAMADLRNMPNLKSMKQLERVWVSDCVLQDLKWLEGSNISQFLFNSSGRQDFSPLSTCERLKTVNIDLFGCDGADLSGFAPSALRELKIGNGHNVQPLDLNALSACEKLEDVDIQYSPIRNLEFLRGKKSMRKIYFENVSGVSDLSPVGELTSLQDISIRNCDGVRDYSPIGGCTKLLDLNLQSNWNPPIRNIDWIGNLTLLKDIGLYGCELQNLDFLDQIPVDREINFGYAGRIRDYSALSRHERYGWLHINPESHNYADVADALQNATVAHLQLYDIKNIDLSRLPKVYDRLQITGGGLENLHGLPELNVKTLALENVQRITTLDGIQNLKWYKTDGALELEIIGCPRLTDLSALEGKYLNSLALRGVYTMPDLSKLRTDCLELDYVEALDDLGCLELLDPQYKIRELKIYMPDEFTNLLPAGRLKGELISVSPQFAEQAQALVDEGHFRKMEINYPDHSWQQNNFGFALLNLEELETLPKKLLAKIDTLVLVGDQVIDMEQTEIRQEWDMQQNRNVWKLQDRATGEIRDVITGSMTDLSRVSVLTGLKRLQVSYQAIENLNGVEGMLDLENVDIQECSKLADISGLFTLENVNWINIWNCPVQSIQGIQNLTKLVGLTLANTEIKDMSPIEELDTTEADRQGGLQLNISGTSFLPENAAELNNMSDKLLSFVDSLCIIGDKVYDYDRYEVWGQTQGKKTSLSLMDQQTQEQTPLDVSGVEEFDMSFLSRMPGLKRLKLFAVPIRDLEAVRPLSQLVELKPRFCQQLEDITAISSLPELERLDLGHSGVKSLDGIQGHNKLTELSLDELPVADLNLLKECDFSFAAENTGGLFLNASIQKLKDWSFLSGIPKISWLGLGGIDAKLWIDQAGGTKIKSVFTWFKSQKVFDQFLDEHPEVEQLQLTFNEKITDLSRLPGMKNLQMVQVSNNMQKAIKSLEGMEYHFQLQIQ